MGGGERSEVRGQARLCASDFEDVGGGVKKLVGLWNLEKGGQALQEESCLDHLKFSGAVTMSVCCLACYSSLSQ